MPTITAGHIQKLIENEKEVHYKESPPAGTNPFTCILRPSSIILSAPHGAQTFRNSQHETWHPEDEFTAGMVLLLGEICQTSVIATLWRTDGSDPNEHAESHTPYKRALRSMVETIHPKPTWLLDLHAAGQDSRRMDVEQQVDLGFGMEGKYMTDIARNKLRYLLEAELGAGAVDRGTKSGWDAVHPGRIAAFAHNQLDLQSVQIEMKPSVRFPLRRKEDRSFYDNSNNIIAILQAFVNFLEWIKANSDNVSVFPENI